MGKEGGMWQAISIEWVLLTIAGDSSIFAVDAVVGTNGVGRAIKQSALSACTPDVVQVDPSTTLSESCSQMEAHIN